MFSPPWIEITTNLPCPNMCSYCPQRVLGQAYEGIKILTLENFKQILSNIPKEVIIDFAGFSEPFVNPESAEMMMYAHLQGYKVMVWTTLVGFTEEDRKLIESIPFLNFSVHDIGRGIKKDYPFVTSIDVIVNKDSRAGNLFPVDKKTSVNGCIRSSEYKINVMLPNGDVVLCCQDYGLKHRLGNLLETNYNKLKRDGNYELCLSCSLSK